MAAAHLQVGNAPPFVRSIKPRFAAFFVILTHTQASLQRCHGAVFAGWLLAKKIGEQISVSPTLREFFESELREELEPIARKLLDPKAKS
jgi:hypothetical protein